ncbi:hypothetical protein [Algoriella sp.]|uniref:hypothetical protein n=1 Tax=Algoriella sp. TaxID=1872434 RepID=UPI002FC581B4
MINNKYIQNIFVSFFLMTSLFVSAQFTLNSHNNGWVQVNGSSGVTVKNVVVNQLQMNGPLNIKNWSIVGRVVSPIVNSEKKEFPVGKLKLQFNTYTAEQYYAENYPTINQIGVIQNTIAMSFTPVYFIRNSPLVINPPSGRFGSLKLNYDIIIEAGTYLNSLKSWNNYPIRLEFSLLNEFGNVISTGQFSIDMQISPSGNYDPAPTVSIAVDGSASNGELIFKTMQDYKNGVKKEYPNGLIVSSDTPYDIQVSSLSQYLQSSTSGNLDLNSVKVQLKDSDTNKLSNTVSLSNYNQSLISNSSKTASKKYTIIYSTTPSDSKILNSKPGNYAATLLYTITPL